MTILSLISVYPSFSYTPLASTGLHVNPTSVPVGGVVVLSGTGFSDVNGSQCWHDLSAPFLYTGGACVVSQGTLSGYIEIAPTAAPGDYSITLQQQSASITIYFATTTYATTAGTSYITTATSAYYTTTATSPYYTTTAISPLYTTTATTPLYTTTATTPLYTTTATVPATTSVSVPSITARAPPDPPGNPYVLAGVTGANAIVNVNGTNFAGTYCFLEVGLAGSSSSCSILSGVLQGSFTVYPSAPANLYILVARGFGSAGEQRASCPFLILPSTTVTSTVYSPTVTSTSTSISKTTRSTTTTETSTSYIATTTGGTYTSYLYTWTYPGYTTLTTPTATVTVYGVSVQTIYTGVMTETQQYTVTVSQQNVATVGGGTTTLWSTQTLPTTAMLTVINGTTSVFVTESNYVEPSITVQTVTQTVNPPTTQQSTPEIPLWLIIAIILTAVGGGAVGLFFVLRRGGVLSRLRPKREEEEPEPAPEPKLDTDMKPPEGETETVAQPAPTQVSPSGKVMCGGCGAENIDLATTCELCGLPLVPRTTAESEDAMGKVGTGEGGAWHT